LVYVIGVYREITLKLAVVYVHRIILVQKFGGPYEVKILGLEN